MFNLDKLPKKGVWCYKRNDCYIISSVPHEVEASHARSTKRKCVGASEEKTCLEAYTREAQMASMPRGPVGLGWLAWAGALRLAPEPAGLPVFLRTKSSKLPDLRT